MYAHTYASTYLCIYACMYVYIVCTYQNTQTHIVYTYIRYMPLSSEGAAGWQPDSWDPTRQSEKDTPRTLQAGAKRGLSVDESGFWGLEF